MFGRCNVGVAEPGRYRRLYVRYEENKNSDCSSLSSPAGAIVATMAATNKYLARSNKSHRGRSDQKPEPPMKGYLTAAALVALKSLWMADA
jgi:hypothetical protein